MSDRDYVLELSTEVVPGKKFTVDGDEFIMKNPDHLSEEDESRAMGKFAYHGRLARQLGEAKTEEEARKLAQKLRKSRVGLLAELTTLPFDRAEKLPLSDQARLLTAIQQEMNIGGDDDSDEAAE